jgi:hypothetical protein
MASTGINTLLLFWKQITLVEAGEIFDSGKDKKKYV